MLLFVKHGRTSKRSTNLLVAEKNLGVARMNILTFKEALLWIYD
jgi:hypothetical protein